MNYLGDFLKGATVFVPFNASGADGASITLATNGTPKAYINGGTTEITTGVTLVEDHDAITGRHGVTVDTSGSGFTLGADVDVAVDANTIDGKTVNAWIGKFSIQRVTAFTPVVGLAQAGATGSVTLPSTAVATDDYYNGSIVTIASGTGVGQSRRITDYVGSTKVASVGPNWITTPDTTSGLVVTSTPPMADAEAQATAQEVLYTLAGHRGHVIEEVGGNITVTAADGTTNVVTQPRVRAGSALNPITKLG